MTTPTPDSGGPRLRQILWLVFLAAILISLATQIVSSSDDDTADDPGQPAASERPGSPDVYRQIETETDCRALQATFDENMADWDRRFDRNHNDPLLDVLAGYADAAHDRMGQIGCYG